MIYTVRINDKEYEVEVERGKANIIKTITVPTILNTVETPVAAAPNTSSVPVALPVASGSTVVRAPMPGTVLDIKATVGQPVKQGDLLIVLEAMKMENEVLASGNGTVKQVLISKGASVATDDILIIIE